MSEIDAKNKLTEWQGHWANFLDALNTTNCHTYFSDMEYILDIRKRIQEGDPETLQHAQEVRNIRNVVWPVYEFEKCLNGEDFDFDNHVKS